MNFRNTIVAAIALATLTACTKVDSTEHCVETLYGEVKDTKMDNGLNATIFTDATCFSVTEQNYPESQQDTLHFEAQTADPVTITGNYAVVFMYKNVENLFHDKRTPDVAKNQLVNAVREAIGAVTTQRTISDVFGVGRATYGDSIKAFAQRKAGPNIEIKSIFINNLHAPQAIEAARIEASKKDQQRDAAIKQLQIDSAFARGVVIKAEAEASASRLNAQALEQSPAVLQLKTAEAMAKGLATMCEGVTTCIVGGNVMDKFFGIKP